MIGDKLESNNNNNEKQQKNPTVLDINAALTQVYF